MRVRWGQADLRARIDTRRNSAFVVARPRWAVGCDRRCDAAVVLQAIAGYDSLDTGSTDMPVSDYVSGLGEGTKALRVGVARNYFYDDLDDEIRAAVEEAIAVIGTLVAETRNVQIDPPTDRTVQAAESFAYHVENVARAPDLYQPETIRRIRSGEKVSSG